MRDEIMAVKKELESLKQESFAMELLKDSKASNKRMAIAFTSVLIIVSTFWFLTMCYLVYVLNDTQTIEATTTVEQSDAENNNYIGNDGDIINGTKNN